MLPEVRQLILSFDRYISTKAELRDTTMTNYKYMYNRFVRDGLWKEENCRDKIFRCSAVLSAFDKGQGNAD